MHVLVVDDERPLGESIVEYPTAFDLQASWVSTAEEALQVLSDTDFSVILLDINLPGMNGFSFCRAMRDRSNTPNIFITACRSDGHFGTSPTMTLLLRNIGVMKAGVSVPLGFSVLLGLGLGPLAMAVTWLSSRRISRISAHALVTE